MEIIAILHNIRSLYNVGSIFRTADAAGCKKIYLTGITPSPLDELGKPRQQLTKVSLGAERYVEWEKVKSTTPLITRLKKNNYKIFAIEQNVKSIPYYKFKFYVSYEASYEAKLRKIAPRKIALVMGSEIKGLPISILKRADKILEIPMAGRKESLNVVVAFGIIIFHLIYSQQNFFKR